MTVSNISNLTRQTELFESGGKKIRIETFAPDGGRNLPSILVLHGATGAEFANRFIAVIAQQFATHGFAAHLVYYFDQTGVTFANDETIRRSSEQWLGAVDGAVAHVHGRTPKSRIGIFGYSLGGYLAAAEAMANPVISAAVILAGGLAEGSNRKVLHAPPMLLLHGDRDARVPITEGRRIEAALNKAGTQPEFHVYPGEGHILQMSSYADVVQRGTAFFRKHLVPDAGA